MVANLTIVLDSSMGSTELGRSESSSGGQFVAAAGSPARLRPLVLAGILMLSAAAPGAAQESGAKIVDARGNVRAALGVSAARAAERANSGMVGKLERELADRARGAADGRGRTGST